jgi:hypothetical protein
MANTIKVTEPPKIPTLTLNFKRPSMFGTNKVFGPHGAQKGKFNNATFHTQHKGGTSGGK